MCLPIQDFLVNLHAMYAASAAAAGRVEPAVKDVCLVRSMAQCMPGYVQKILEEDGADCRKRLRSMALNSEQDS